MVLNLLSCIYAYHIELLVIVEVKRSRNHLPVLCILQVII